MRQATVDRFHQELRRRLEAELAAARTDFDSGRPASAFDRCEAAIPLLSQLPAKEMQQVRDQAGALVGQLVARRGIVVDPIKGHLLAGSLARYNETMVPEVLRGLKAKGYLPREDASPWRPKWSDCAVSTDDGGQ